MKKKIFLVSIIIILTIINLMLFANFYNKRIESKNDIIQTNLSKI